MADSDNNIANYALVALGTVILGITGWSLLRNIQSIQTDAELAAQILLLQQDIKELRENKEPETRQDRTIRKHWKLHTWAKDQINEIQKSNNVPLGKWPDFPDE
jgi:alkylated DNA repair dioxygenase AlkB